MVMRVGHMVMGVGHMIMRVGHMVMGVGHMIMGVGHMVMGVGHMIMRVDHMIMGVGHMIVVVYLIICIKYGEKHTFHLPTLPSLFDFVPDCRPALTTRTRPSSWPGWAIPCWRRVTSPLHCKVGQTTFPPSLPPLFPHPHLTEVRPHERQKSVYRCRVMGSKNCGKTTFVRGLIGKEQVNSKFLRRSSLLPTRHSLLFPSLSLPLPPLFSLSSPPFSFFSFLLLPSSLSPSLSSSPSTILVPLH